MKRLEHSSKLRLSCVTLKWYKAVDPSGGFASIYVSEKSIEFVDWWHLNPLFADLFTKKKQQIFCNKKQVFRFSASTGQTLNSDWNKNQTAKCNKIKKKSSLKNFKFKEVLNSCGQVLSSLGHTQEVQTHEQKFTQF